ncbi:Myb_DNA-bind_3 domain-containing protein, partial [Cephalotus follicularis]
ICVKEIDNGGRPKSHFTKEAWKSVVETFHRGTGRAYNYHQLKNKWDQFKKEYLLWKVLLGIDIGLGSEANKGTLDASDDWREEGLLFVFSLITYRFNYIKRHRFVYVSLTYVFYLYRIMTR